MQKSARINEIATNFTRGYFSTFTLFIRTHLNSSDTSFSMQTWDKKKLKMNIILTHREHM